MVGMRGGCDFKGLHKGNICSDGTVLYPSGGSDCMNLSMC